MGKGKLLKRSFPFPIPLSFQEFSNRRFFQCKMQNLINRTGERTMCTKTLPAVKFFGVTFFSKKVTKYYAIVERTMCAKTLPAVKFFGVTFFSKKVTKNPTTN